MVERLFSNRKIADPWFDFRSGNASLCPWERHSTRISHSRQAVLPIVVAQLDERLAKRTQKRVALRWFG